MQPFLRELIYVPVDKLLFPIVPNTPWFLTGVFVPLAIFNKISLRMADNTSYNVILSILHAISQREK